MMEKLFIRLVATIAFILLIPYFVFAAVLMLVITGYYHFTDGDTFKEIWEETGLFELIDLLYKTFVYAIIHGELHEFWLKEEEES